MEYLCNLQDLDRCERMLKAQVSINRDLSLEMEEMTTQHQLVIETLQQKMDQMEHWRLQQQSKKTLLTSAHSPKQKQGVLNKTSSVQTILSTKENEADETIIDDDDLNNLIQIQTNDLKPGENVFEMWILEADLNPSYFSPQSCTFLLCDFYDFESQSTPLIRGDSPVYNFATTFVIQMNEFLMDYLATEDLVFELHETIQGDFQLLGRATLSLQSILRQDPEHHRQKPIQQKHRLPIYRLTDECELGTLEIQFQFAFPIDTRAYLHLESIAALSSDRTTTMTNKSSCRTKTTNQELMIQIHSCRFINDDDDALDVLPSAYIHFQFLGFPDMFTNIVPSCVHPEFRDSVFEFPIELTRQVIRFFKNYTLVFTVFNDKAVDETESVIGSTRVPVVPLVEGPCAFSRSSFDMCNAKGHVVGEIQMSIKWKHVHAEEEILMVSGSSSNVVRGDRFTRRQWYEVCRLFSPDSKDQVDYTLFHKFVFASPTFLRECHEFTSEYHWTEDEWTSDLFPLQKEISWKAWMQVCQQQQQHDQKKKNERSENSIESKSSRWKDAFQTHFCILGSGPNEETWMSVFELRLFLSVPTSDLRRVVESKLRSFMKTFDSSHVLAQFQRLDPTGRQRVTRSEFQHVLNRCCGLEIHDERANVNLDLNHQAKVRTGRGVVTAGIDDDCIDIIEPAVDLDQLKPQHPDNSFEQRRKVFLNRLQDISKSRSMSNPPVKNKTLPVIAFTPLHSRSDEKTSRKNPRKPRKPKSIEFRAESSGTHSSNSNSSLLPPSSSSSALSTTLLDLERPLLSYFNDPGHEIERKRLLVSYIQKLVRPSSTRMTLSRTQFAHCLHQLSDFYQRPDQLTSVFTFFRASAASGDDGIIDRVDVSAFLEFINYRLPQHILPQTQLGMSQWILSLRHKAKAFAMDSEVLDDEAFAQRLHALGLDVSHEAYQELVQLFDSGGTGVHWHVFLDVLDRQPTSQLMQRLERKIQCLKDLDALLLRLEQHIPALMCVAEFQSFLQSHVVKNDDVSRPGSSSSFTVSPVTFSSNEQHYSNDAQWKRVFYSLSRDSEHLSRSNFKSWIQSVYHHHHHQNHPPPHVATDTNDAAGPNLAAPTITVVFPTIEMTQELCWNRMDFYLTQDPTLEHVESIFRHYDVPRAGVMSESCFIRCLDILGFPFSTRVIQHYFRAMFGTSSIEEEQDREVEIQMAYPRFLHWAMPPRDDRDEDEDALNQPQGFQHQLGRWYRDPRHAPARQAFQSKLQHQASFTRTQVLELITPGLTSSNSSNAAAVSSRTFKHLLRLLDPARTNRIAAKTLAEWVFSEDNGSLDSDALDASDSDSDDSDASDANSSPRTLKKRNKKQDSKSDLKNHKRRERRHEAQVTELRTFFQSCRDQGRHYRQAFETHDGAWSGHMTLAQCHLTLEGLGFYSWTKSQFWRFARCYPGSAADDTAPPTMDYHHMLHDVLGLSSSSTTKSSHWKIEEGFRRKCRLELREHKYTFDELFEYFSGSSHCSTFGIEDLIRGLVEWKWTSISLSKARMLMQSMTWSSTNDKVSRVDFHTFLFDAFYQVDVHRKLRSLISEGSSLERLAARMTKMDTPQHLGLSVPQLEACLSEWTPHDTVVRFSNQDVQRLLHRYDVHRNGHIAYRLLLHHLKQHP